MAGDEVPIVNPVVNPNARVPIHEVIQQLRKYDGQSDAREFFNCFKYDITSYGLSFEWAIRNFDRVLQDNAESWWMAKWPSVETDLSSCDNADEFEHLFSVIEREFYSFFDNSAQESTYRRRNKQITFKLGECPTRFVTEKLKVLRLIDPEVRERKKVVQIIKGLPYNLRQTMTLQSIDSVQELLVKLRNLAEIHEEHVNSSSKSTHSFNSTSNTSNSSPRPNNYNNSRTSNFQSNSSQTIPPYSIVQPLADQSPFSSRNPQQVGPVYPKGKNLKTVDGKSICNYCHYANHNVFNCEQLLSKNSRPTTSRNSGGHQPHNSNAQTNQNQSSRNGQFYNSNRNNNAHQLHSLDFSTSNYDANVERNLNYDPVSEN